MLRKVPGLWLSGTVEHSPKRCFIFYFFKDSFTLSLSLLFLSADRQPRRRSGVKNRRTKSWMDESKHKNSRSALFLFCFWKSCQQLSNLLTNFIMASWPTCSGRFFAGWLSCVRFVKWAAEASVGPLLRCSDEYSDRDSFITIVACVGSLLLGISPSGGVGIYCGCWAPPPFSLSLSSSI